MSATLLREFIMLAFCLVNSPGSVIGLHSFFNFQPKTEGIRKRDRENGRVPIAVPSKLGWIPRHCWKNGVKPLLSFVVSFVLSATPQTGGNGQGI